METSKIEALISAGLPGCTVTVEGDGSHFDALVVSDAFAGKSPLEKQRMVMATVKAEIESGELHALSIKTMTPEQAG